MPDLEQIRGCCYTVPLATCMNPGKLPCGEIVVTLYTESINHLGLLRQVKAQAQPKGFFFFVESSSLLQF